MACHNGNIVTHLASSPQVQVSSAVRNKNPNGAGATTMVAGPHDGVRSKVETTTSTSDLREARKRFVANQAPSTGTNMIVLKVR